MRKAFCCAGCGGDFDWTSELPVSGVYELKTIGSRYCVGCIDTEVVAHGVSKERIIEMRRRIGRVVP